MSLLFVFDRREFGQPRKLDHIGPGVAGATLVGTSYLNDQCLSLRIRQIWGFVSRNQESFAIVILVSATHALRSVARRARAEII
jgi:hypothetical protein